MRRALLPVLALLSCQPSETPEDEPSPLLDVDASASWTIPGMTGTAHVMVGEAGIPQIYAENRNDLGRVLGFVAARDRYFYMDLARRQALGELSDLLGADALENDQEARGTGMTFIVDRLMGLLDEDPEMKGYFEAYAEGVNAYIEAVRAGELAPPTEYDIAFQLLGADSPLDLMKPFDLRAVVGGMTVVLYESGFETKDVGRTDDFVRAAALFEGAAEETLRKAGVFTDVWNRVEPVHAVAQAPGWGAASSNAAAIPAPPTKLPPASVIGRLRGHLDALERRLGHDWENGFGSNAWAVAASASADGRALIASDGHLPLSVPPLFYQVGMDTKHLGDGDIEQLGLITPAMPLLSTGTNGRTAFGQTQLIGDITDWYLEEIVLDPGTGAPASSVWQDGTEDLVAYQESFHIASVPLLGSQEADVEITRYTTFDGRWITSIEGREVGGPEDAGEGETAVNLLGDWVVPGDTDGDGVITGISFDYAGLDLSNMARVIDDYTRADDVAEFEEATSSLVAYSLNLVVADSNGDVLYTGFQAVPCRTYLDRNGDGTWADGADPSVLLDGTRYGGFTIPINAGKVDFSDQSDPYRCVIPYDEYPHEVNPEQGYVVSANNDPGGLSFDGSLTNDPWYIGGPWQDGYRPNQISEQLESRIASGGVTIDGMKAVQADHTSSVGQQLVPELLDAIDAARALEGLTVEDSEARVWDLYDANRDRIDEVASRLAAWQVRDYQAESGVETFYESPTAEEQQDAVATMIFNAWVGRFMTAAVSDEGFPGLGFPTGTTGRFRLLKRLLDGRGPDNPLSMGSWNPDTEESVYFDDLRTEAFETSTEIALVALVDALDFLESPPTEPGKGGFGTDDMDQWLWGMRHWVRFTSLLGDFFGVDDPILGPLIDPLNIDSDTFPVAEGLSSDDPRAELPGFPRHGDLEGIDALNPGSDGVRFDNSYGSVFRMVVALGQDGFEAWNVIPGGQSGLTDSPFFSDQAELWLGNDYIRVHLDPADVAAAAVTREVFE